MNAFPKILTTALCVILLLASVLPIDAQESRTALVIGNSKYEFLPALRNPQNDADTMSVALANLGFTVYLANNLKQSELVAALGTYAQKSKTADVSVIFYAGHSASLADQNLVFPIDFNPADPAQISALVKLTDLTRFLTDASRTNIILFDACQEPITLSANGQKLQTQSLSPKAPPIGTLISYASTPGSVAHDGVGNHSIFTGALLDNLARPDTGFEQMLRYVRRDVIRNSQGTQVPQTSSSLVSEFIMYPETKPSREQRLESVLAQNGFSQKTVLSNVSSGLSAPTESFDLTTEAAILRDVLCKKLSAPLPAVCKNKQ